MDQTFVEWYTVWFYRWLRTHHPSRADFPGKTLPDTIKRKADADLVKALDEHPELTAQFRHDAFFLQVLEEIVKVRPH